MSAIGSRSGPSTSSAIGTIAADEIRRLVRDRIALFFMVVLPVMIMVIIGGVSDSMARHTRLGVVDLDRSADSRRLVAVLRGADVLDVSRYSDVATVERDIRSALISGGLVIPRGYGSSGGSDQPLTLSLYLDQNQSSSAGAATIVSGVIAREGARLGAADLVVREVGGDRQAHLDRVEQVESGLPTVKVRTETVGSNRLDSENGYAYTAPANLVLFTFINSVMGAAVLVESRRLGVARRMLAAPVSATSIMLGQGLSRLLVALLQSLLILGVGAMLFGVAWGDPLAAALLVGVFAAVSAGAGLLVSTFARKSEKVTALGIPISLGMAMIGGCMWPLEVVPAGIRAAGHLTPHAWAMDGWISLVFEDGDLGSIAMQLAVLGGVAALLLVLSAWRMRRVLTR